MDLELSEARIRDGKVWKVCQTSDHEEPWKSGGGQEESVLKMVRHWRSASLCFFLQNEEAEPREV